MAKEKISYSITWSDQDQQYVGTSPEFPILSYLDPNPDQAYTGIRQLIMENTSAEPDNVRPKQQNTEQPWKPSTQDRPLPEKFLLACLRDGRLHLRSPIEVTVTKEGKQTVASAEELNEFGVGENQTEATADLQKAIADLYFTLKENQEHLAKGLQKVWDTLQSKIALQ